VAKTTTQALLDELNAARGVAYPAIGYSYYADIRGDGRNNKSVWTIINAGGGVTSSELNGKTPRDTCAKIRAAISKEKTGVTLAVDPSRPWFPAALQ
jgi:hypothetical protein